MPNQTNTKESDSKGTFNKKRDSKSKFVPLGIIIVPTDSEPKLESTIHVTWARYFSLNGFSSLICVETLLSHFCFPLTVMVGACLLTVVGLEDNHRQIQKRGYRLIPNTSPGFLCGILILLAALSMLKGTSRRNGGFIIASILILLVAVILLLMLSVWMFIRSSEFEINEYLQKTADGYGSIGLEERTAEFDDIQRSFQCCGLTDPTNWLKSVQLNPNPGTSNLPNSCCQRIVICQNCTIKVPQRPCYYTKDQSDIQSFRFHRMGCVQAIRKYYAKTKWRYWYSSIVSLVVLILVMAVDTLYFVRIYARLSNHVHPKIRTLVDEIVDKAEDEIFHVDTDDSVFDSDVKDYLRFNLSRCETIEEVQEFLSATADVRTYIRHLQPEDFARDILSGKPILLQRFEKALEKLKSQKQKINQEDPYLNTIKGLSKDDEILKARSKARKEWRFLKSKVQNFKIFTNRAEDFQLEKRGSQE